MGRGRDKRKDRLQNRSNGYLSLFLISALSLMLLALSGCRAFGPKPTPTPPRLPIARVTATLALPTPPPGATLTALVEAYRRTRTPAFVPSPTSTPSSPKPQAPTAVAPRTPTPSATTIGGLSIYVVPEVAEAGALVEVQGVGWLPGEEIRLWLGTTAEDVRPAGTGARARGNGTFSATVKVPTPWTSDHLFIIAQSVDGRRRAITRLYLVTPTATPSPGPTETRLPSPTPTPTLSPSPSPSPTSPPTATPTPRFRGWRGQYYANPNLQGDPVQVRDDSIIDFDWGLGAPAENVPADGFSVRWTRQIDFVPGGYQFMVQVDDGVRVYINNQLVLDEWKVTATATYDFQQRLDGPTEIRVEYFDAGGNATIRLQWHYLGRFPNWRGAYYNNRTLSGTPVLVRDDRAVTFDWGVESPAPEVPPDNFSVRWSRTVTLEAGTYRFHALADDGVRVWVDDLLVIDEWHLSTGETDYTADIHLARGSYNIRIEYYEAGGEARVHVWWENLDAYTDWRGAYYDNRELSGQPAFVRNDIAVDFDWGQGSPNDIGPDNFSVRWTTQHRFEDATYRFFAEHDDGVRVWVDGELIIDEWYETGRVTHLKNVELTAGIHEIRVDYFEASGDASIRVWWELARYR